MQRIQKIRSILEEKQIDAILIKSRSNKRYLGALTGSGVKVLVTRDELYQIMDGRYSNEARETTSGFIRWCMNRATAIWMRWSDFWEAMPALG